MFCYIKKVGTPRTRGATGRYELWGSQFTASDHTSAQDRIVSRQALKELETREMEGSSIAPLETELVARLTRARWLCPLRNEGNRRGFLAMDLDEYLGLLDWTGRQVVTGKRGAIPSHLAPILSRLEVEPEQWIRSSQHFGSMFYRAAGKVANMTQTALRAGQKWLKGLQAGQAAFLSG